MAEGPYNDTSTILVANATFTGAWHDHGIGSGGMSRFGGVFYADKSGTAYVDMSNDGSNVAATVATLALTDGQTADLDVRVRARYYRVRYVNGGIDQTAFNVNSSFTSN